MKKLFMLTLCFLALFSLAACGGSEANNVIDFASLSPEYSDTSSSTTDSLNTSSSKPESPKIIFEEVTVVDNDECTIKITEIDPSSLWGYSLNTYLENKSTDITYRYSIENASVNGIEIETIFFEEVAPGKKSITDISFLDSSIEDLGIDFTDIEMTFKVYDSNDWSADPVALETIHIYPYGEDKAVQYTREPQPTDIVIADNEYVTAIITGYGEDDIWGYTANIFLVNKSNTAVSFLVDDVSVNGFMSDPFWGTSVLPGKCAFSDITWLDSTLEKSNITEVEEIEFIFRAYESYSDDIVNERVTICP